MLQPLPSMWQRTSSSWRSPMRIGAWSAARGKSMTMDEPMHALHLRLLLGGQRKAV